MPGPRSVGIVHRRDVRELREPGLLGTCSLWAESGHLSGATERSQEYKESGDSSHIPSSLSLRHKDLVSKKPRI